MWRTPRHAAGDDAVGVRAQLVGHHDHAGQMAVDPDEHLRLAGPVAAEQGGGGDLVGSTRPAARRKAWLPTATRWPSTIPTMPWPGSSRISCGVASTRSAASAARTSASPRTCADTWSTDAASRSSSLMLDAVARDDVADLGGPDGERARLVEQDGARLAERLDRRPRP